MEHSIPDDDLISGLQARLAGDPAGEAMLRELVSRYRAANRSEGTPS